MRAHETELDLRSTIKSLSDVGTPSVGSHPSQIVAQFMDDRQADLFADFGVARADRFNILLIRHDVSQKSFTRRGP
jgi:hypothetical protein